MLLCSVSWVWSAWMHPVISAWKHTSVVLSGGSVQVKCVTPDEDISHRLFDSLCSWRGVQIPPSRCLPAAARISHSGSAIYITLSTSPSLLLTVYSTTEHSTPQHGRCSRGTQFRSNKKGNPKLRERKGERNAVCTYYFNGFFSGNVEVLCCCVKLLRCSRWVNVRWNGITSVMICILHDHLNKAYVDLWRTFNIHWTFPFLKSFFIVNNYSSHLERNGSFKIFSLKGFLRNPEWFFNCIAVEMFFHFKSVCWQRLCWWSERL